MKKQIQFLREAYAELQRVTWPTYPQTVQYTILVIIISLSVATFLGTLDYFFGFGIKEYLLGGSSAPAIPEIGGVDGLVEVQPEITIGEDVAEGAVEDGEVIEVGDDGTITGDAVPEGDEAQ